MLSRTRRFGQGDRVHGVVPLEDLGLDLGKLLLGEHAGVADYREQVERDAVRRLRSFEGRHGGPPWTGSRRYPRFPRCPLKLRRGTKISKCVRFRDPPVTMTIPHREQTLNRMAIADTRPGDTPGQNRGSASDAIERPASCQGPRTGEARRNPNLPVTGQVHPYTLSFPQAVPRTRAKPRPLYTPFPKNALRHQTSRSPSIRPILAPSHDWRGAIYDCAD